MSEPLASFKDLPIAERIELVADIWDSIAEQSTTALPMSREDLEEMHRRLSAHRADPGQSRDWEDVLQLLHGGGS
jgi:putative addiction module component (TIGR02574 family)